MKGSSPEAVAEEMLLEAAGQANKSASRGVFDIQVPYRLNDVAYAELMLALEYMAPSYGFEVSVGAARVITFQSI